MVYPAISLKDSHYQPVKSDHQIKRDTAPRKWLENRAPCPKPTFGHSFRWQALLVASSVACGNQGIEKEAELLGSSICYTPLPVPWRGNLCPTVNKRRLFPGAELDCHQLSSRIWKLWNLIVMTIEHAEDFKKSHRLFSLHPNKRSGPSKY